MSTHTYEHDAFRTGELGPPMSAADVSGELVDRGFDRERAQAMVAGYLDATSRELGVSVHRWGLDEDDLDRILARHQDAGQLDEHGFDAASTGADTDVDTDADSDGDGW